MFLGKRNCKRRFIVYILTLLSTVKILLFQELTIAGLTNEFYNSLKLPEDSEEKKRLLWFVCRQILAKRRRIIIMIINTGRFTHESELQEEEGNKIIQFLGSLVWTFYWLTLAHSVPKGKHFSVLEFKIRRQFAESLRSTSSYFDLSFAW